MDFGSFLGDGASIAAKRFSGLTPRKLLIHLSFKTHQFFSLARVSKYDTTDVEDLDTPTLVRLTSDT